ncbi:MAG: chemotaxis protein [Plesiomonas sp.]
MEIKKTGGFVQANKPDGGYLTPQAKRSSELMSYSSSFSIQSIMDSLYFCMGTFADLIQGKYNEMQRVSTDARNDQEMSNRVDEVIAEAAKGDDKTKLPLPDSVIDFMKKNNILIDGEQIGDYLKKYGPDLDKGKLQAVKAALDNAANRSTDISSKDQLDETSVAQKYNTIVAQISGLQTMFYDMKKSIIQTIRY